MHHNASKASIPQTPLSHLSAAFATGFALGAAVGLISAEIFFFPRHHRRTDRLEEEVEAIRRELHNLRSASRPDSPVSLYLFHFFSQVAHSMENEVTRPLISRSCF